VEQPDWDSVNRKWFFDQQEDICEGLYADVSRRDDLNCKLSNEAFAKETQCRKQFMDNPGLYSDIYPHSTVFCNLNTRQCDKRRKNTIERSKRGHPVLIIILLVSLVSFVVALFLARKRILRLIERLTGRKDLEDADSELDIDIQQIGTPLEMESDTEPYGEKVL